MIDLHGAELEGERSAWAALDKNGRTLIAYHSSVGWKRFSVCDIVFVFESDAVYSQQIERESIASQCSKEGDSTHVLDDKHVDDFGRCLLDIYRTMETKGFCLMS